MASKTLKTKVDKTVDNFHPLTVNWLLGRLVNTLVNKANGAVRSAVNFTLSANYIYKSIAYTPILILPTNLPTNRNSLGNS